MKEFNNIIYLQKIRPFINLKAICDNYNLNSGNTIDYNNLRAVLNGISTTRVSEEKLSAFTNYIHQYLFVNVFEVYKYPYICKKETIEAIINKHVSNLTDDIIKEIENEF